MSKFAKGDVITNGSSAGTVIEIVDRDPHWKTSGVRVMNIGTDAHGGDVGLSSFVPDYLTWQLVPFEWAALPGGQLEVRYVWADGYRRLTRELRPIEVKP